MTNIALTNKDWLIYNLQTEASIENDKKVEPTQLLMTSD